ncbi:MAG: hypothetical protein KDA89_21810, partial [Planctomycetaceae bacterium]|nr:hypothetical protein [Planctomycetaceae bacterium]
HAASGRRPEDFVAIEFMSRETVTALPPPRSPFHGFVVREIRGTVGCHRLPPTAMCVCRLAAKKPALANFCVFALQDSSQLMGDGQRREGFSMGVFIAEMAVAEVVRLLKR